MGKGKKQNQKGRYNTYRDWMNNEQQKEELKNWLEKAGVPLELRAFKALEEQGYRCSSFHYKDYVTGKYRELDIYAWKTDVKSFSVKDCNVAFDVLILAECKYSHYSDFLAFERKDKYFPAFPVIFEGNGLLGASYKDFEFPIIIRKIAETDVKNLESPTNFNDKETHDACEKLTSGFSQFYERRKKSIKTSLDQHRLRFEPSWKRFLAMTQTTIDKWGFRQKIGEFLKDFKTDDLLRQIPYFSVQVGFPILIIPQERGLIRIKHDVATGQIIDFENVGYGIFPFVSENADNYDNILREYFEFPIIICSLEYLDECLNMLNKGIDKMANYAQTLLQNNPKAIAAEVLERIFEGSVIEKTPTS